MFPVLLSSRSAYKLESDTAYAIPENSQVSEAKDRFILSLIKDMNTEEVGQLATKLTEILASSLNKLLDHSNENTSSKEINAILIQDYLNWTVAFFKNKISRKFAEAAYKGKVFINEIEHGYDYSHKDILGFAEEFGQFQLRPMLKELSGEYQISLKLNFIDNQNTDTYSELVFRVTTKKDDQEIQEVKFKLKEIDTHNLYLDDIPRLIFKNPQSDIPGNLKATKKKINELLKKMDYDLQPLAHTFSESIFNSLRHVEFGKEEKKETYFRIIRERISDFLYQERHYLLEKGFEFSHRKAIYGSTSYLKDELFKRVPEDYHFNVKIQPEDNGNISHKSELIFTIIEKTQKKVVERKVRFAEMKEIY